MDGKNLRVSAPIGSNANKVQMISSQNRTATLSRKMRHQGDGGVFVVTGFGWSVEATSNLLWFMVDLPAIV